MLAQYLLTFREVLEAALLTAIILAFLTRTGRSNLARFAWYGVFGAVGVSLVLGSAICSRTGPCRRRTRSSSKGSLPSWPSGSSHP